MKLTTAIARNLEPPSGKTDHIEWDEDFPGFGVRLRIGNNRVSRMWVYQYNIGRRTRRLTLGNVNAFSIQDARRIAGEVSGKVRLGGDPVLEKAESRARADLTFGVVVDRYLKMAKPRLRPLSYRTTEQQLQHCKPLYPQPFANITRREIAAVLSPISSRGTLMQHNRVRARLRAIYNWAIGQGLADSNPVIGITKHKEKSRDRVLSMPELVAIWHILDDVHSMIDFNSIIRLLMLTGQRRGEIGDLRWNEIVGNTIVLPGTRTKNGRIHIVSLSQPAQAILFTRLRARDDDFVFRRRNKNQVLLSWDYYKTMIDRALIKRGHKLAPWTFHDLRRSVATHMGEMTIPPHVIEAVLNHVGYRGGISGVYNKSTLDEPKRQALEAWGEHLMAHVEGRVPIDDKIVPFGRAPSQNGRDQSMTSQNGRTKTSG